MRKDVPYSRNLAVDAANAIEWDHPDNAGLKLWMYGLPGTVTAGGQLNNLVNANLFQCVWQGQTPSSPIWKTNSFDGSVGFCNDLTQTQYGLISSGPTIGSATGFSIFGSVRVNGDAGSDWPLYCERAASGNDLVRLGVAQGGTRNNSASVAYRSDAAVLQQPSGTTEINSHNDTTIRGMKWFRIGLILSNGFFYVSVNGNVESTTALSGSTTMTDSGRRAFINGDNASGGRLQGESSNIRVSVGTIGDPVAYTRRDYQWCRTPQADPRIRWFSTRAYLLPSGGGATGFGTASGSATATGVGSSLAAMIGTSTSTGAATGIGSSLISSLGSSTGSSAASSIGSSAYSAFGVSAGLSTSNGIGSSTASMFGTSVGSGSSSGIGSSRYSAFGSSNGTSTAIGIGPTGFTGFVDYINVSGIPGTGYNIIGRSPN